MVESENASMKIKTVTNGDAWKRAIILGILAFISGGGGAWSLSYTGVLRPHPFTSIDYAEKSLELRESMQREFITEMQSMQTAFIVEIKGWNNSVDKLQGTIDRLVTKVDKVERAIIVLPPPEWRDRIRTLEDHLLKTDPTFDRGTGSKR